MKSSMFKVLAILICVTALTASPVFAGKPPKCTDAAPPTVDAFDIPTTSETLTVSITTFTASDDCGVDGYMVTESATAPAANDPNWSNSAPASYTVASEGIYTLYAWALDGAGNVSSSMSDTVTVAFPALDADTLDGLDSTDFALQSDLDTAVANLEIADANPILPVNIVEPFTCQSANVGAIVLTGRFTTCVCNGADWVSTADGITSCEWVGTVTSAGQVWMDRNLGASQVATSSTDSAAYGDLYQWGRGADGHQIRTSGTTDPLGPPSNSDDPGHGDLILTNISQYFFDWRYPQNNNLWQGVGGINNPCMAGFRLPTETELETERASWSSNDSAGAFDSPLRLPLAGSRPSSGGLHGGLYSVDINAWYWSSTISGTRARSLKLESIATMQSDNRGHAFTVRCIQD